MSSTPLGFVLAREGPRAEATAMIGDRALDVIGARANRILPIGVTWGYGSRAELIEAGAALLVETPRELVAALKSTREARVSPWDR